MAKGYQKRKRASKYEKKLAINASFEDVIKIALGMEPDTILHFSRAENKTKYEFKDISAIAFKEIKMLKGKFDDIKLEIIPEYQNNIQDKVVLPVLLAPSSMAFPAEDNTLGLIQNFIPIPNFENLIRATIICVGKDDFDFQIRYVIR